MPANSKAWHDIPNQLSYRVYHREIRIIEALLDQCERVEQYDDSIFYLFGYLDGKYGMMQIHWEEGQEPRPKRFHPYDY